MTTKMTTNKKISCILLIWGILLGVLTYFLISIMSWYAVYTSPILILLFIAGLYIPRIYSLYQEFRAYLRDREDNLAPTSVVQHDSIIVDSARVNRRES